MWGGATFDTAMRFLQEDPWDRLDQLRVKVPNILFQMLLRASNAVGYTNYPDNVVKEFTKAAAAHGIDVFRIFDSLNWADNMKVAVETVRDHTSAICEAAICYTGDILDPKRTKYSLEVLRRPGQGTGEDGDAHPGHQGHGRAVQAVRRPCPGEGAARRGGRAHPLPHARHRRRAGGEHSQCLRRRRGHRRCRPGQHERHDQPAEPQFAGGGASAHRRAKASWICTVLNQLSDYWEAVRQYYYPFEEDMKAGTAEVYQHEMPGGQYTNLRQQAKSMGLESRWHEIADAYAQVNRLFGDIVKVTPSSKVVGDMALFMVTNGLTATDVLDPGRKLNFPRSVVEMMQGMLGQPEGGWPKVLQKIILDSAGEKPMKARPGAKLPKADFPAITKELAHKLGREPRDVDVQSYLMYPQVFLDYQKHLKLYDNTSVIPTSAFFYGMQSGEEISVEIESGKTLIIRYLTTGEARDDGTRTVFFELNGQPRQVNVPDRSLEATLHRHPKADPDDPDDIPAPMPGKVTNVAVKKGQPVKAGERLLSIEAMKMETAVYSPREARVKDVLVKAGSTVGAGDLLVQLEG